jgi:hypothetical protein
MQQAGLLSRSKNQLVNFSGEIARAIFPNPSATVFLAQEAVQDQP